MKNIIVLIISISVLITSCTAQGTSVKSNLDKYSSMSCIDPADVAPLKQDKLTKAETGKYAYAIEVKGVVEANETGQVYLVVDPSSRSRRTYLITGQLTDKIAELKGNTVTVKCCYLEKRQWSGTIRVYEILK